MVSVGRELFKYRSSKRFLSRDCLFWFINPNPFNHGQLRFDREISEEGISDEVVVMTSELLKQEFERLPLVHKMLFDHISLRF